VFEDAGINEKIMLQKHAHTPGAFRK